MRKQYAGESDSHYYQTAGVPPADVPDILAGDEPRSFYCKKCSGHYEGDGEHDNGLCHDCDA